MHVCCAAWCRIRISCTISNPMALAHAPTLASTQHCHFSNSSTRRTNFDLVIWSERVYYDCLLVMLLISFSCSFEQPMTSAAPAPCSNLRSRSWASEQIMALMPACLRSSSTADASRPIGASTRTCSLPRPGIAVILGAAHEWLLATAVGGSAGEKEERYFPWIVHGSQEENEAVCDNPCCTDSGEQLHVACGHGHLAQYSAS